jgi:hypothetical protein
MITERPDPMDVETATVIALAVVLTVLWATKLRGEPEPAASHSPASTAALVSTQSGDILPATITD